MNEKATTDSKNIMLKTDLGVIGVLEASFRAVADLHPGRCRGSHGMAGGCRGVEHTGAFGRCVEVLDDKDREKDSKIWTIWIVDAH